MGVHNFTKYFSVVREQEYLKTNDLKQRQMLYVLTSMQNQKRKEKRKKKSNSQKQKQSKWQLPGAGVDEMGEMLIKE